MANKANAEVTPTVAVAAPKRTYTEDMVITVLKTANPKRAASAARYALYLAPRPDGKPLTVREYLDGCLALHPDEPRYRWRADLAWDEKREFITVTAPAA